jgi:hypothetical protein
MMLVPTNYAVIHLGPYFEVKSWNRRNRTWDETDERLYLSREECRPTFERLTAEHSGDYEIIEYSHVYRCLCVICGDSPDYDEMYLFPDWYELVAYLAGYSGWVTTSEVDVLCPDHRSVEEV